MFFLDFRRSDFWRSDPFPKTSKFREEAFPGFFSEYDSALPKYPRPD